MKTQKKKKNSFPFRSKLTSFRTFFCSVPTALLLQFSSAHIYSISISSNIFFFIPVRDIYTADVRHQL